MKRQWRLRRYSVWLPVASLVGLVVSLPVHGQNVQVVQVEEDWELRLFEPDPNASSPQISCTMSPQADLNGWYAVWTVNYGSVPTFTPGGIQLQLWQGGTCRAVATAKSGLLLCNPNERVKWTLRMRKLDGRLVFDVVDGESQSWGNFSSSDGLSAQTADFSRDLSGYNPTLSVQNSEVGYGGNRVSTLMLKRVRVTFSDGTQWEDANPQTAYPLAH